MAGVDTKYLRHAFAWVELAAAEPRLSEQTVGTLAELLTVTLRTIPASTGDQRESSRFPTKFGQWVLDQVGRADALWRPILGLRYRGQ